MKRIITAILLIIGFSLSVSAQSKMKEKASERANKLNMEIVAGDKSQALTDDQMAQITELEMKRLEEVRGLRKSNADKEAIKAVNKKYFKQMYSEVLTKKQKKARREGKDKVKKK
ncbi:hypothetical protein [Gaetbulibacter aestuarii]|uniref:DUF4890 domain-containing protein n=1 Tax=Gaetbulibacter aestuarii TaxID=1502358 RepID=A0ABW7N125_9FLAO